MKADTSGFWAGRLDGLSDKRRQAMEFLRRSLPASDLAEYPFDLFLEFADHALMLREASCGGQPTLTGVLARWPGFRVLVDDWAYDLADTARRLTCDPDAASLAVVCDGGGNAVFGASGYRVGLGNLLVRVAIHLCA